MQGKFTNMLEKSEEKLDQICDNYVHEEVNFDLLYVTPS